jgi:hypothetical protein
VPRHPDAAAAILVTGVHFGDITGAKPHSGTKDLSIEELGELYGRRTGLAAAKLKALPP